MSNKHRKDLNKNRPPRFVQLFHFEMDCAAYKDLGANARGVYAAIKRRYNGSNNGLITYSIRQAAEELKIGKSTSARAFDQLQSHGFIVAEQRGHFHWKINPNGSKIRPASEWRLTIYDNDRSSNPASTTATKDFMRWPQIQNAVPPQVRLVPNTGPSGTQHGTAATKTNSDGPRGGTKRRVGAG